MSVYLCEDFAEERNRKWKHQDDCLLCEALKDKELREEFVIDDFLENTEDWIHIDDCDDSDDKCINCKHKYEEE